MQFGAEFAEISKLARNIDDVSIDSARVDLKELGGDDFNSNMNFKSIAKDADDLNRQGNQDPLKQKRGSQLRKAAGTGDVENNHRVANKLIRSNSNDRKLQESITSNKDLCRIDNDESESCYINQSEI